MGLTDDQKKTIEKLPPNGNGDCFRATYQLGDLFRVIDHIGSGGNAAVVRGFVDEEYPREIALKILDPRCVTTDDRNRENRKFEHPNLVRIQGLHNLRDLGFNQVPDWYNTVLNCEPEPFASHPVASCSPSSAKLRQLKKDKLLAKYGTKEFFILVMEYCPISLSDHILRHSRSMEEVHRILTEVCAGLTAMHREGIIHTDIQINNILMTNQGLTKIADFGLSEHVDEGRKKIDRAPEIAAPELIDGEGDPRSDIYSLGLLTFELATGHDLLLFDMNDENEDVSSLNVPTDFVAVCKQASQFEPDARFSTLDNFLEALNGMS